MTGPRSIWCATVATALLLCVASVPAQETASPAAPTTAAAQRLVTEGKAAEAKVLLDALIAASPKGPAADEARTLLARIRSVEVFIDCSHEAMPEQPGLAAFLMGQGIGVTQSHADVAVSRKKLADYELVVLWQRTTRVKYDDVTHAVLSNYVGEGGRLLLIGEPARWRRDNPDTAIKRYPLHDLARRFRLKTRKRFEERAIGKGKVFYYRNRSLFTRENFKSTEAETRDKLMTMLRQTLPYDVVEASSVNTRIEPELTFKTGRVTFRYAQSVAPAAMWVKKTLPTALAYCRKRFGSELTHDITLTGLAGGREAFTLTSDFPIQLATGRDVVLHQLTVTFCRRWMRPEGTTLQYPAWFEGPWMDMAVLDFMTALGGTRHYNVIAAHRHRMFLRHDPKRTRINIINISDVNHYGWCGKCYFIYRDLHTNHAPKLLERFREMVLLYHAAGKLPEKLDTAETIRLLSIAAGKDLFPYFRALGTKVTPVAIDFDEPKQLRAQRAAKTDVKTEQTPQ